MDMPTGLPCVITSDDILKLGELPRSLIVVGCGVIGVEYASMFAALGVKVTVVDGRERPLEFLDGEIVDELIHQMRNSMVTLRLGESVEHVDHHEGPPHQALVHLQSGKRLVADLVLACTGRVGASEALGLERAGLSADARGRIKVGGDYRSDVPNIFAAGRRDRLSQPCGHVLGTGPAGRAPCLRHARRTHARPFSGRHLLHPRDFHGRPDGAGADPAEGALRDRHRPLPRDRPGPDPG